MPVDNQTVRPYDPSLDPGAPVAPAPGWAKIAVAVAGMLTTTLSMALTVNLFPSDSVWAKLIAVAIAGLGSVATAVAFIIGEGRKEQASIQGAARVTEAKIEAKADVAIAQATGQPPPPSIEMKP